MQTQAPSVGQDARRQLDPQRHDLPPDLLKVAAMMQGSAPAADAVTARNAAGDVAAKKADVKGRATERDDR